MKPWEQKIVPMGFGLAGVLFIIAAVISAFKGKGFNAAFFSLGTLFLILGVATARKSGGGGPIPPSA